MILRVLCLKGKIKCNSLLLILLRNYKRNFKITLSFPIIEPLGYKPGIIEQVSIFAAFKRVGKIIAVCKRRSVDSHSFHNTKICSIANLKIKLFTDRRPVDRYISLVEQDLIFCSYILPVIIIHRARQINCRADRISQDSYACRANSHTSCERPG